VVRVEDQFEAAPDDVGAAGEQPLRDQDVDLAELRRREIDADLLGLHSCSSQIPDSTLTDSAKRVKAGRVRMQDAGRVISALRTRNPGSVRRTLRTCDV